MWQTQIFGFSLYQLVWFFVLYSFLGWCSEVCFCSINTGKWVNRGFLSGPVCPIYGFGMLIILVVLTPLKHNLLLLFVGAMLLASLLELVTGYLLKKLFHTSWWDYSDHRFQLGGYICLKFSILWGAAGTAVVLLLHPAIQMLVDHFPPVLGKVLIWPLLAIFVCDAAVTVVNIAKLNRSLGEISRLTALLQDGTDHLAQNLGSEALAAHGKLEEGKAAWNVRRENAEAAVQAGRADLQARLDLARADLLDQRLRVEKRLLHAFPRMKHTAYTETFEELKRALREKWGE